MKNTYGIYLVLLLLLGFFLGHNDIKDFIFFIPTYVNETIKRFDFKPP